MFVKVFFFFYAISRKENKEKILCVVKQRVCFLPSELLASQYFFFFRVERSSLALHIGFFLIAQTNITTFPLTHIKTSNHESRRMKREKKQYSLKRSNRIQ